MYLIQDATDVKFAGLITDGTVQASLNEMLTGKQHYSSQGPLSNAKLSASPFDPPTTMHSSAGPAPGAAAGSRPPPARASAATMPGGGAGAPPVATTAPAQRPAEDARRNSLPPAPPAASTAAPAAPPAAPEGPVRRLSAPAGPPQAPVSMAGVVPPPPGGSPAVATRKVYVTTAVEKGELGIGLDLGKSKTGQAQVLRLKEFPPEAVNPATLCNPPIQVGDVIVAVNGVQCASLAEAVKVIRAAVGLVQLTLEREV